MHRVVRRSLIALSVLAVAWGALAFGAVYPWSYYPLAAMCAIGGLVALATFRPSRAPIGALAGGLGAIAFVIALQLVPLSPSLLARVSPGTDRFLRNYDLAYSIPVMDDSGRTVSGSPSRPITLDPPATRTALLLFGTFAVFTLGLAALLSVSGAMPLVRGVVATGVVLALVGIIQYTVTGGATYTLKIYGFWTPEFRGSPFGPFVNRNHFAGWMLMGLPLAIATACGAASGFRGPGLRRFIAWLSASRRRRPDAVDGRGSGRHDAVGPDGELAIGTPGLRRCRRCLRPDWYCGGKRHVARAAGRPSWRCSSSSAWRRGPAWTTWCSGLAQSAQTARVLAAGCRHGGMRSPSDAISPLIGAGLNSFSAAMLQYQTSSRSIHFEQAHNDYLQLVAEGGFLLCAAVAMTLLIFIGTVRKRFREAPHEGTTYWARVGAVIGLLAIAVQSIFEFSLQLPGNAAMFCVLAAIAIHRSPSIRITDIPKDINYGYPSNTR